MRYQPHKDPPEPDTDFLKKKRGFNWTNTTGRNINVFVDNAGITASAFKINGTTVYASALGDFSAPLQDQEWVSYLYTVGTPTIKYKPF